MHAHLFGLRSEAFSLTPDPSFLYLSPGHSEALAALRIGLEGRRGLMAMTGEVGTGKTTLIYALLGELGPEIRTAYLSNTKLAFDDMLRMMLADLGVVSPSRERVEMLAALNDLLRNCAERGETVALIIDEAQNLSDETFEHLRLLSNFETFQTKLLQIVLVGQPELEAKLQRPSLRQIEERIAVRCRIDPLSRRESLAYLRYRLQRAGGSSDLFTHGALRLVTRRAGGIPRRINILCHNALLFAYGREARRVTRSHVRAAVRERKRLAGRSKLRSTLAPRRSESLWSPGTFTLATGLLVATGAMGVFRWSDHFTGAETAAPVSSSRPATPVAPANPPVEHAVNAARPVVERPPVAERPGAESAAAAPSVPDESAASTSEPLRVDAVDRNVVEPDSTEAKQPPFLAPAQAPSVARHSPTIPSATKPDQPLTSETEEGAQPPRFRLIHVPPGATLSSLVRGLYGEVNRDLLSRIESLNPQLADPDRILAGDVLRFPEPQAVRE